MELEFRDSFLKDVKRIKEAAVKKKITAVISVSRKATSLLDLKNVKKLEGSTDYYRIRVGNYRIGIKLQGKTLIFMRCLNRKDIYRYFP
jgi:mRNA interferase RelE/StbE